VYLNQSALGVICQHSTDEVIHPLSLHTNHPNMLEMLEMLPVTDVLM
jgi:hypothetical protein